MLMFRGLIVAVSLIFLWQLLVWVFQLPAYILPSPLQTLTALINHAALITHETGYTIIEALSGLLLGSLLGCAVALSMILYRPLKFWLIPVLIISQALPTFAIAPLLVIWFGYGVTSKIITTMLMLFFPVASAFFEGLRRTDRNWLDLAKLMRANQWQTLWRIRIPAALPSLAAGLRIATAAAPIGAIIGEWVGASHGLGFLMLNADARMQIDLMFAALFVIIIFGLGLYFCVDKGLRKLIHWQQENHYA